MTFQLGYTTKSIAQRLFMHEFRLGDEIDDFCIKCKRLTNHAIVSLLNGQAAKVRCRTCYHDHDFRNGEPLPSKKELKKQQLLDEALAAGGTIPVVAVDGTVIMPDVEIAAPVVLDGAVITADAEAAAPVAVHSSTPVKKGRKSAGKSAN